jgi:hypothetical protein
MQRIDGSGPAFGIIIIAVALCYILFIGLTMLISPRRWFDLPRYIGLHGSMRRHMLSTWGGRLQVRLLGLALVTFVTYVLISISTRPTVGQLGVSREEHFMAPIFLLVLRLLPGIGLIMIGTYMVVKPLGYLETFNRQITSQDRLRTAPALRIFGLIVTAHDLFLRSQSPFSN